MSDEHNNLDYEYNDQGDKLLNQSEDQEEPMEQEEAKQGEKNSEDSGSLLTCDEDIFDDDPLTDSQLMAVINTSTPVDLVVSAKCTETQDAL